MTSVGIWEVEMGLIYSLIVAGKSANFAEKVVTKLLAGTSKYPAIKLESPFQYLRRHLGSLDDLLRECKTGNYQKLTKAIPLILEVNPLTISVADLEAIPGIGPKTSRFFYMWIHPESQYAALDTHILKWLRSLGHDAPKVTPTGRKYLDLEKIFIGEAQKQGKTPRELDMEIWLRYAGRNGSQMELAT